MVLCVANFNFSPVKAPKILPDKFLPADNGDGEKRNKTNKTETLKRGAHWNRLVSISTRGFELTVEVTGGRP